MSEHDPGSPPDPRASWNRNAAFWDDFLATGMDIFRDAVHAPALLAACGPVGGQRVLDLGCGEGGFSRLLARAGALVVGVDIAEEQIAHARQHEERDPLAIAYCTADAAHLAEQWPSGSFPLVTACMALHDMADPASALRAAWLLLPLGGRCVFSIPHLLNSVPVRQWERDADGRKRALKLDRYFDGGPASARWRHGQRTWETPYWHRPLGAWSTLIAEAGFLVRHLVEPRATPEQVRDHPTLDACERMPYFLIFELVKIAESRTEVHADR